MEHYKEEYRAACLRALREEILMGMDSEQPLRLNDGDSLHIIYTEDGQVGVRSELYHELYLEALEIAHRDAVPHHPMESLQ